MLVTEGLVHESMPVSHVGLGHKLEFGGVTVCAVGVKVRETVSRIRPGVKEGPEIKGFRSEVG
jgi:hypothetical protein